jgi:hypothetical protein
MLPYLVQLISLFMDSPTYLTSVHRGTATLRSVASASPHMFVFLLKAIITFLRLIDGDVLLHYLWTMHRVVCNSFGNVRDRFPQFRIGIFVYPVV